MAADAMRALLDAADPERARVSASYFKTGPGQYGQGDEFIGLTMPRIRTLVRRYRELPLREITEFLNSPLHEARMFGLLVLVLQYQRGTPEHRDAVFRTWIEHIDRVNNWDLVDLSARVLGWQLESGDRSFLYHLVESDSLWHRRIAIIATQSWIAQGDFADALELSRRLLGDREDLIHKAVGWMLREIGKVDAAAERRFLRRHAEHMPRTMLRYAIEKFPEAERRRFLAMKRRRTVTRKGRTAEHDDHPHR